MPVAALYGITDLGRRALQQYDARAASDAARRAGPSGRSGRERS